MNTALLQYLSVAKYIFFQKHYKKQVWISLLSCVINIHLDFGVHMYWNEATP
jgi:hypothetical protein